MKYTGSCHCGAITYEFEGDIKEVLECNCSHCSRKGLLLYFIPNEAFKLLSGAENLSEYFFNKKAIRHVFCKTCGVQAHAEGVAFPQVAINMRCVADVDITKIPRKAYNGKDV